MSESGCRHVYGICKQQTEITLAYREDQPPFLQTFVFCPLCGEKLQTTPVLSDVPPVESSTFTST